MCLAVRVCAAAADGPESRARVAEIVGRPWAEIVLLHWGLHEGNTVPGVGLALGQLPGQRASFPIRSNIGRYMAITMPPTTTPRKATISGSSRETSPATAASASSS